jgi:hypothetical protein
MCLSLSPLRQLCIAIWTTDWAHYFLTVFFKWTLIRWFIHYSLNLTVLHRTAPDCRENLAAAVIGTSEICSEFTDDVGLGFQLSGFSKIQMLLQKCADEETQLTPPPSRAQIPQQFTHALTEMSTRSRRNNVSGEKSSDRGARLTKLPPSVSRFSRHCGILNISQPYRPPWPITGVALLLFFKYCFTSGAATVSPSFIGSFIWFKSIEHFPSKYSTFWDVVPCGSRRLHHQGEKNRRGRNVSSC